MLTDERYGEGARRFAERYAAFDLRQQGRAMLERCEALLSGREASWAPEGQLAAARTDRWT